MSKSNDISKLGRSTTTTRAATFTVRQLRDDELQEVSGGASDPYRGFSFHIDVSGTNRGRF